VLGAKSTPANSLWLETAMLDGLTPDWCCVASASTSDLVNWHQRRCPAYRAALAVWSRLMGVVQWRRPAL